MNVCIYAYSEKTAAQLTTFARKKGWSIDFQCQRREDFLQLAMAAFKHDSAAILMSESDLLELGPKTRQDLVRTFQKAGVYIHTPLNGGAAIVIPDNPGHGPSSARVWLYASIRKPTPTSKEFLQSQENALRTYALEHGHEIVGASSDFLEPGYPLSGLEEALRKSADFDLLLCVSTTRLGRDLEHVQEYISKFQVADVSLYFIKENLMLHTPFPSTPSGSLPSGPSQEM